MKQAVGSAFLVVLLHRVFSLTFRTGSGSNGIIVWLYL